MSLNRFGAVREKPWHASVIKGKLESAQRIRAIERTTGLLPFQAFDWTPLVYPAYQLGNSCLGFSAAQCIWLWLTLHGFHPEQFPDPYVPYWHARRRRTEKPTDSGAFAGDLWWAISTYKVPPMANGPDELWAIQELTSEPKAHLDFAGVDIAIKSGAIYDDGSKLVDRILDSAAKKQPVQICLPVDEAILDAPNESLVELPKKPLNIGHATTLVAARKRNGRRELKVYTNWRGNPFLWIPEEYAAQAYSVRFIDRVDGWV